MSGQMRAAAAVAATTDDKQLRSDLSTINSLFCLSVRGGRRVRRGGLQRRDPARVGTEREANRGGGGGGGGEGKVGGGLCTAKVVGYMEPGLIV